jgi:hypothetical protein
LSRREESLIAGSGTLTRGMPRECLRSRGGHPPSAHVAGVRSPFAVKFTPCSAAPCKRGRPFTGSDKRLSMSWLEVQEALARRWLLSTGAPRVCVMLLEPGRALCAASSHPGTVALRTGRETLQHKHRVGSYDPSGFPGEFRAPHGLLLQS